MRRYKVAYVGAVLAVGLGSVAVTFAYPDNEVLLMAVAYWVFAVLTFPLGFIASAIGLALLHMGLATPAETTVVVTPMFAVLGYVQWCRLLPAFYGTRQ
ncbi:hypothetical protein GOB43_08120 [Sinorhizobium meliloti]|uniref:hypothetical protein n=1 Tax=Rhizobium meliloti TaxID=382 RepID=UPI000614D636|nr:hypothetical protein [Sinorhizobium meliloti]MDW9517271.1 hypothetical protein [Sinorhizobium meliloti]RVG73599.1 hypothetical protein CN223_25205 [Sinorhizobium meliloti]RVR10763.1 hypothetical protein CN243_09830 [Sinorhizobium meliloti]